MSSNLALNVQLVSQASIQLSVAIECILPERLAQNQLGFIRFKTWAFRTPYDQLLATQRLKYRNPGI